MDTHYNFRASFEKHNREGTDLKFYEALKDIDYEDMAEIEENTIVYLKFQGEDKGARLYLEELDLILLELLEKKQEEFNIKTSRRGEIFLCPSEERVPLCKDGVSPFIPGIYLIKVFSKGRSYYSAFKVINKIISKDEAKEIRRELEEETEGISFDFVKRKFTLYEKELLLDLPKGLYKFFVVANEFKNIMNSLVELRVRPNYKITKSYSEVRLEKVRYIDNVTLRKHLSHAEKQGFMKVPIKSMEYDLPENRWVKKIVLEIQKLLTGFIREIEEISKQKQRNIEEIKRYSREGGSSITLNKEKNTLEYILELREKAFKMKSSINILKSTEWYNSIREKEIYSLPHVLIQDSRYNVLYKVYERMNSRDFNFSEKEKFTLQWKKTDKLYEMWCYIKLCNLLKSLGYKEAEGQRTGYNLEESSLKVFKREDIKIKFYYDTKIPKSSEKTDFEKNPLFIRASNNRPDGRMDIYKGKVYLGSLIFEFKYRRKEMLWDSRDYYKHLEPGVCKQLISYSIGCASKFILREKGEEEKRVIPIFPVNKVLVFYPKDKEGECGLEEIGDYGIKFIEFKPKKNLSLVEEELKKEIDLILERESFI